MATPAQPYRYSTYGGPDHPGTERHGALVAAVVVLGVLLAVLTFLFVLPTVFGGTYRYFGGPYPFFWAFGLFFLTLWVIFAIARFAFWGATGRWGWYGRWGYRRGWDPAFATARHRYASGEITREQYQQIVEDIHRPYAGGWAPPPRPP